MVKEKTEKKIKKKSIKKTVEKNTEKVLIENFVALQKVMASLSLKFDNLSEKISKLLELFELSAKNLAEKEYDLGKDKKDNEKIIKKIDGLYEQNKIIAKGLTMLSETNQESVETTTPIMSNQSMPQVPMPGEPGTIDIDQYQRSISSTQNPTGFKKLPRV